MPLKGGVEGWKGVYHLEGDRYLLGRMSMSVWKMWMTGKSRAEATRPTFAYDQLVLGANWMTE